MALCLTVRIFFWLLLIVHSCFASPMTTIFEFTNINQSTYPTASRARVNDCSYRCFYATYAQNSTFCYGFYFDESGGCQLDLQVNSYDPNRRVPPPHIQNYFSLLRFQSEYYTTCNTYQDGAYQGAPFFEWKNATVYHAEFEDNLYMVSLNSNTSMYECIDNFLYNCGIMPLTIHSIEENKFIAALVKNLMPIDNPVYLLPGIAKRQSGPEAIKWAGYYIPTTEFDFPWASGQPLLENGHTCIVGLILIVTIDCDYRDCDSSLLGDHNGEWTTANCSSTTFGLCIGKINKYTLAKEEKNSDYLKVDNYVLWR